MKRKEAQLKALKRRFIWSRVLQATIAIAVFVGLIWLVGHMLEGPLSDAQKYLSRFQDHMLDNKLTFYSIYSISELLSFLPPEVFILTLEQSSAGLYLLDVSILSAISYLAGILMYLLGIGMGRLSFFKRFIYRFYKRELRQLKRFGGILILLAALTPVPYVLICLLVGASGLSFRSFWVYAASRFLRFLILGYLLWHVPFAVG